MTQLIVLDCDGVLTDYNKYFKSIYEEKFGTVLNITNEKSFHIHNYYDLKWENDEIKKDFFNKFNDSAWDTVIPLEGAIEATQLIKKKGYKIIALSNVPEKHQDKIHQTLVKTGFIIDATIAFGRFGSIKSKKKYVEILQPEYFVDDLKSSFYGLDSKTKNILIDAKLHDSPNNFYEQNVNINATYSTLYDFVKVKI